MEEIFKRRSIREYQAKNIEKEKIEKLIKAGVAAPSAGNQQPWHFIVVQNRESLNKIAEIHPHAKMLKEAPLAIAVCADLSNLKYEDYWVQDCAAATQNILLEAEALDLGGVWLGVYPDQEKENPLRELFELPENIKLLSIVSLGYPAEEKSPSDRYSKNIVHSKSW
ncbi:nitroreductase family protein [Halanaerobium hydrogeniformans]|uniref:Nitroreductase n=1 Tax=Halanaerobium hydrogeniformans TaxID=656519 RepID=E4RIT2_HALHG|nr:nitroreductase family protein [Halanaerobium hydrogeniformans]ADQ15152.1 nitroreductase [Halanaerobium hydrogeniformans]